LILFSGDEVTAHFVLGSKKLLLISFFGAYHEREAMTDFFLRDFVVRNDFSCVGITTCVRGFYLSQDMEKIEQMVRQIAKDYEKVILIGESMGAYAAIKFSKRFDADAVMAFAPIYSLDLNELNLANDLERKIVHRTMAHHKIAARPEFDKMGIKKADARGFTVVVYDPDESSDDYSAKLIQEEIPDSRLLPIRHSGHTLYSMVAGDRALTNIVDGLVKEDAGQIREVFRVARRSDVNIIISTLSKAARKKPYLCVQALRARRVTTGSAARQVQGHILNNVLAVNLILLDDVQGGHDHLCLTYGRTFDLPFGTHFRPSGPAAGCNYLILSLAGMFLFYSLVTKRFVLDQVPGARSDMLPVLMMLSGDSVLLSMLGPQGRVPLALTLDQSQDENQRLTLVRERNVVSFRSGAQYVRAVPDGSIDINAHSIGDWERFALVPLSANRPLITEQSIGWFERSLMNEVLASAMETPVLPVRKVRTKRRWSSLFSREGRG
jgi:hypothetical protein